MNKWKIIAPVGIISAGAAIALALSKKTAGESKKEAAKESVKKPAEKKAAAPHNIGEGSYSFVSGYKDAATYQLNVKYDADAFDFAVVSEEYLIYSGDSHVAILRSEDYSMQIEYASYYQGEGFAQLAQHTKEKYATFSAVTVNGIEGIRYIEGDTVTTCLPAGDDEFSYVIISAMKAKDSKIELPDIVNDAPLAFIFSSVQITKA